LSASSFDAGSGAVQQLCQRADAELADTAGHDQREEPHVRRKVQREAVHGDPAGDAHADRAELDQVVARLGPAVLARRVAVRPQPDVLFEATGRHAVQLRHLPHHLGQVFHVAAHVFAIGRKVDDRVADQLPRRVQRDVAAAARLHDVDAQLGQARPRREQVFGVSAAPQRDHRRMLDEQHRVADGAGDARRVQLLLQREARAVVAPTEEIAG